MDIKQQKWCAADYARNSSAQLKWAEELIAKLALVGDERLVDIGCGDGKITAHLAGRLSRGAVVGIDASPDMIALAAASFPAAQYPNLDFRCMDATALTLPQDSDIAFSNAALHWVADHQAVLRGVRACLRTGGRLLFQMGGRGNAREVFSVLDALIRSSAWRGYFEDFRAPYYFYGIEEYGAWLPALGFTPKRVELMPKDMQHDGRNGLKGWLRTTWFPYTDCLPAELREVFLDEVVEAYAAEHPLDREGRTHVDMVRLEVEAIAA